MAKWVPKKDGQVALNLRLPGTLHERLAKEAEANARSLNAEILLRLQDSFGERPSTLQRFKAQFDICFEEALANEANKLVQALERAAKSNRAAAEYLADLKRSTEQKESDK